jgi:hypothetical protein
MQESGKAEKKQDIRLQIAPNITEPAAPFFHLVGLRRQSFASASQKVRSLRHKLPRLV